ncbi:hypothetical protein MESS2_10015 [Mesorhizobium metallidurans STM 2683]|uniref:Uncharacterized protein n=1 Tax=Mesorhizobium metallidurans STM 2683 TaxID=1297569 RepID=M5EE59_9HYPH|nr:hypothetical protein MESS2_10015 [Mesorhizobium metallidurans STM 2683]
MSRSLPRQSPEPASGPGCPSAFIRASPSTQSGQLMCYKNRDVCLRSAWTFAVALNAGFSSIVSEIWRGFNAVALQIADDRSVALSIALGTVRDADHMRRFRRSNPGRRNSPQRCVPAHRHSEPVRQARARVAIHGGVCVAPAMTSDSAPCTSIQMKSILLRLASLHQSSSLRVSTDMG